ncbi:peroxisomal membrane protein PEX31 [Pyrenophora tritici-repentis Pt-1C-BFP]|uniref:Peroxisomal membrane protein PEX31 n=1 Tax=Pyrenophora tritici-repentis (strain Pt-1C-BFP) TaxID=426418 RepID=B2WF65_PYRTR|nr:peroxisomal membrane protein PEX31 [Pyrenophora tritici-repentis Pt-1C-BFP]EDU51145.1 peroxisomal membrane protein PEX31 [Pyrenophora tritici-repentis Pt-1C-BFP]
MLTRPRRKRHSKRNTPWIEHMSTPSRNSHDASSPQSTGDPNPPTYATFSPANLGQSSPQTKLRSAILVHQKSPLLAATPPQVTRVLAYSHPFILPLNKFAGLVTWTTGDPWESFLLVASFWAIVMYGDAVTRYAGPIMVVSGLILGMYTRRYSPLSSTGWTGEKQKGHNRIESDTNSVHHKSLEEIVDSLKLFTSRCNILLDPFLRLTDFLSTQRTATSATTRPALTVLFIRILFVLPLWIALTLPPFYILTTKRVVLAVGTVILSWHSRPARITRTLLWRSKTVRRICAFITGLNFGEIVSIDRKGAPPLPPRKKSTQEVAASLAAKRQPESTGVRFTFSIYENQRRWLGIGWTSSMLAYERASWTDEHLNSVPPKEEFELPEIEGGQSRWRWVQGSEWKIDCGDKDTKGDKGASKEESGWIYYDNKWRDGRRGQDGWGRYTRRRKWYRDAELVEASPSTDITPIPTPKPTPIDNNTDPDLNHLTKLSSNLSVASSTDPTLVEGDGREYAASVASDNTDAASTKSKRNWFKRKRRTNSSSRSVSGATVVSDSGTTGTRRSEEDDVQSPLERIVREEEWR